MHKNHHKLFIYRNNMFYNEKRLDVDRETMMKVYETLAV